MRYAILIALIIFCLLMARPKPVDMKLDYDGMKDYIEWFKAKGK